MLNNHSEEQSESGQTRHDTGSENSSLQPPPSSDPGIVRMVGNDIEVTTRTENVPFRVRFDGDMVKSVIVERASVIDHEHIYNCQNGHQIPDRLGTGTVWTIRPRFSDVACPVPSMGGTVSVQPSHVDWLGNTASIIYIRDTNQITIQLQNVIEGGGIDD